MSYQDSQDVTTQGSDGGFFNPAWSLPDQDPTMDASVSSASSSSQPAPPQQYEQQAAPQQYEQQAAPQQQYQQQAAPQQFQQQAAPQQQFQQQAAPQQQQQAAPQQQQQAAPQQQQGFSMTPEQMQQMMQQQFQQMMQQQQQQQMQAQQPGPQAPMGANGGSLAQTRASTSSNSVPLQPMGVVQSQPGSMSMNQSMGDNYQQFTVSQNGGDGDELQLLAAASEWAGGRPLAFDYQRDKWRTQDPRVIRKLYSAEADPRHKNIFCCYFTKACSQFCKTGNFIMPLFSVFTGMVGYCCFEKKIMPRKYLEIHENRIELNDPEMTPTCGVHDNLEIIYFDKIGKLKSFKRAKCSEYHVCCCCEYAGEVAALSYKGTCGCGMCQQSFGGFKNMDEFSRYANKAKDEYFARLDAMKKQKGSVSSA